MKKLLGILVLGFLLSNCADYIAEKERLKLQKENAVLEKKILDLKKEIQNLKKK